MLLPFPPTWTNIQDFTHAVLVVGVSSSAVLALVQIVGAWQSINRFTIPEDLTHLLVSIFILVAMAPVTLYFSRIVQQYDERLQTKQKEARLKKENLTKSYNDLLSDMDQLLTKSAESNAGLAERSFESKRRDFQRFLERAKSRYTSVHTGTKANTDQLLKQFRRFCINWLTVFQECSIDPINSPKRVVTAEELNRCTSIAEVADLCLDRLRVTEVNFIKIQRDQDVQLLRKNRKEFRRLTGVLPMPALLDDTAHPNNKPDLTPATAALNAGSGWFAVGGFGCNYAISKSEDGYPKELCLGCCRFTLISYEHVTLMQGFFCGWLIVIGCLIEHYYFPLDHKQKQFMSIGMVIALEACIIMVLHRFEEIDTIQQLEREVQQLSANTAHVQEQREKMAVFWSNVQQLTELWLYRTVPRLDLYKELHSQLEDTRAENLLQQLAGANRQLEDLEQRLGPLEAWRNNGTMSVEDKKEFGRVVNKLCQEQDIDELLVKLEDVKSASGNRAITGPEAGKPLPTTSSGPKALFNLSRTP